MIAEHAQTATESPIVLQCVDLCKCYNGVVQASDHINFTLCAAARCMPFWGKTVQERAH